MRDVGRRVEIYDIEINPRCQGWKVEKKGETVEYSDIPIGNTMFSISRDNVVGLSCSRYSVFAYAVGSLSFSIGRLSDMTHMFRLNLNQNHSYNLYGLVAVVTLAYSELPLS